MVTSALGRTPPLVSLTVPLTVARLSCPTRVGANSSSESINQIAARNRDICAFLADGWFRVLLYGQQHEAIYILYMEQGCVVKLKLNEAGMLIPF